MRRVVAASLIGTVLLAGCVPPEDAVQGSAAGTRLPSLAADRAQPRLALADHLLGNYFASDVSTRPTVCVAVNDGREDVALDPALERELMMRYEALSPLSGCALIDGGWQDAVSNEPALVFTIHSFTCADADHCTGFGSYVSGRQSSLSSRYTLLYEGDAWGFTRDDRLLGAQ